jgi:hypothetical protein
MSRWPLELTWQIKLAIVVAAVVLWSIIGFVAFEEIIE